MAYDNPRARPAGEGHGPARRRPAARTSTPTPSVSRGSDTVAPFETPEGWEPVGSWPRDRARPCIFNQTLPGDYPYVNAEIGKKQRSA